MSDDSGRDERGQFAPGNTLSPNTGGGYGIERQVYDGKISERLAQDVYEILMQLEDGKAHDLHDGATALAGAVVKGIKKTFSDAYEAYESNDGRDKADKWERVYRADRSLHSWIALYARLLQHPDGDDKTSAAKVLDAIRSGDNEHE